ncbi:hypothetical protein SBDP1_610030 [Syntrophobacter sp. SbD1]|nr:hypothetical protein SBDP1_610030 [Syntrophobacter sp. SbD1]
MGISPALTGNVDIPGGNILGEHTFNDLDLLIDTLSDETKAEKGLTQSPHMNIRGNDE